MELGSDFSAIPCGDLTDRLHDKDERHRGHEEAEDDVASGFDAGFSSGECAAIDSMDGFV